MNEVAARRRALQSKLFPRGIPRLWCPTLTHFQAARQPDARRIRSHLRSLSARVHGILVPGSTGEGWEMNDDDIRQLLDIVVDAAQESNVKILIGVLKTSVDEMLACIDAMHSFLEHPAVIGVTVCPPKGADLSQEVIRAGLAAVLDLGLPTALYQLPQVTQNEMSAETVRALAEKYDTFILFKDTSGEDRVAQSGIDLGSVFMVRGAELGGYAAWPRTAGGLYDGFLLSTANVFSKELDEVLRLLDNDDRAAAQSLSQKLVEVVNQAFALVRDFPVGNAFANANKVLDHCMAYGEAASRTEPPLLYSGNRLPNSFIESSMRILKQHALLPASGYLSKVSSKEVLSE
jgi:dihydrodipicolinate synthase/N-acetylneuraminate lyase